MNQNHNISYYVRKPNDVIVRLVDGVNLEYLNPECKWMPNQEWFVSMFVDREDIYQEISEAEALHRIYEKLNSSQININEDSKYPKMTR